MQPAITSPTIISNTLKSILLVTQPNKTCQSVPQTSSAHTSQHSIDSQQKSPSGLVDRDTIMPQGEGLV